MDIMLSNNAVPRDAARGTVIGTFNLRVKVSGRAGPFFAVEGKNLVAAWDGGPPDLGAHDIRVHTLPTGPRRRFTIHVVAPPAKVAAPADAAPAKRRPPPEPAGPDVDPAP